MRVHAVILLLLLAVIGYAQTPMRNPMRNLDGGSFDPAANRGKIVVLAFGSIELPTAKLAVPGLQKLAERYADRPVSFYWVSVDSGASGSEEFRLGRPDSSLRKPVRPAHANSS